MTTTAQTTLALLAVLAAIAYTVRRLHQTFSDPCHGCKGCALSPHERRRKTRKEACREKKVG